MTNKVRAVAESHPLRNIRHALLRVLQQPASIAQPGAADKFAGRFAEFCVEQAVELAFTQCHFSRKPGGGERPGQELFNQHDGAAQPRVRDKRKIRRTWGGNFMRNERQTLTGGAGDIIPGMGADKLSCQRQGGNTARAGQHIAIVDEIIPLLSINQRESLPKCIKVERMDGRSSFIQQSFLCEDKTAGANANERNPGMVGMCQIRFIP